MSKKNGGRPEGVQVMDPMIQTCDPEFQTREVLPAKPTTDPEPSPYVVRMVKNLRVVECPRCRRMLLGDRMTQACVVTKTMPESRDDVGAYTDRYVLCRGCNQTSRVRERAKNSIA